MTETLVAPPPSAPSVRPGAVAVAREPGAPVVGELAAQLGSTRAAAPRNLLRQLVRFSAIGAFSTLAYLLIYSMLHAGVGAQAANLIALLITAVANTAANRRFTFGVRGGGAVRQHAEGLVVFGLTLALTSGSLALLHTVAAPAAHWLELAVLIVANLTATVLRFTLLRGWVFRPNRD